MSRPYRAHYAGGMAKGRPAKRGKGRADAAARRPAAEPKSREVGAEVDRRSPDRSPMRSRTPKATTAPGAPPEEPRTFRLGAIPGATPGKWIDAWKERMPHVPLELVPLTVAEQRSALHDLDAALVRLPIEREGIDAIPLYDEVAVVIVSVDSALTVADELTFDDLAGEVVIVPEDDALGPLTIPGAARPHLRPARRNGRRHRDGRRRRGGSSRAHVARPPAPSKGPDIPSPSGRAGVHGRARLGVRSHHRRRRDVHRHRPRAHAAQLPRLRMRPAPRSGGCRPPRFRRHPPPVRCRRVRHD